MRNRFLLEPVPGAKAYATVFGDYSFLLLAFFLVAGSLTAMGGHLHAALPKALNGCVG